MEPQNCCFDVDCLPVTDQKQTAQNFSYIVIIDFESTCWDKSQPSHPNEISKCYVVNTSTHVFSLMFNIVE